METVFIGDWYIRVSDWHGRNSITSSLSVGKYHINRRGKKVLEGAKKRFPYYQCSQESFDAADSKAVKYIMDHNKEA